MNGVKCEVRARGSDGDGEHSGARVFERCWDSVENTQARFLWEAFAGVLCFMDLGVIK